MEISCIFFLKMIFCNIWMNHHLAIISSFFAELRIIAELESKSIALALRIRFAIHCVLHYHICLSFDDRFSDYCKQNYLESEINLCDSKYIEIFFCMSFILGLYLFCTTLRQRQHFLIVNNCDIVEIETIKLTFIIQLRKV